MCSNSQLAIHRGYLSLTLFSALILLAVIQIYDLAQSYAAGGLPWKQTDWLINVEAVWIRRGLFGSALIRASDLLRIDLLSLTVSVQAALITASSAAVYVALRPAMRHASQAALVMLPPSFQMMSASHFGGVITKELIALTGLGLLARLPWVGAAILAVAFFAHEATIFFLPLALYILWKVEAPRTLDVALCILGVMALAYAFHFRLIQDESQVCNAFLSRGVDPHMCDGPTRFLTVSLSNQAGDRPGRNLFVLGALLYPVAYAVSAAAFAAIAGRREYVAVGWVCVVPVLPLFLVANDFGRWFSMAYMSLLFVAGVRGLGRPNPYIAGIAVLVSLFITFDPVRHVYLSGLVNRVLDGF